MKIKFSGEQKRLWETFLFLIKILVFAVPLYLILTFQGILYPLQELVSHNVYLVLNSLGFQVARDGFLINIQGGNPFVFLISEDCTGWKSMLFLTALIIAVPSVKWRKRGIGLVFGIPLIYMGNLLRILIIVHIEQVYGLELANLIHDYLWQAGLISLVLVIWVAWLIWLGKVKIDIFKR
ncbi:MAG: hypothetical protein GTN76_06475 [Candidatus Aenigmarchaeota archaeon]|nr:hypothetical protein [Candidatus Aenigmarchaeota archaeon]